MKKILLLSDNEEWITPYVDALQKLGVQNTIQVLNFDGYTCPLFPAFEDIGIVYARMSPSAAFRGKKNANEHMVRVVRYYEQHGIQVVNGKKSMDIELDKGKQFSLLQQHAIPIPKTIIVKNVQSIKDVYERAQVFHGPFLLKPNKGGSGYGIRSFTTVDEIQQFSFEELIMEVGDAFLLQEIIPYEDVDDPHIYRIEYVGGTHLYTLKVRVQPDIYNNCAADACQDGKCGIEASSKEKFAIVEDDFPYHEKVLFFLKEIGSDIAGIEFIKYKGEYYCIDPNVANTNYGLQQEVRLEQETGKHIRGHMVVAKYLSDLLKNTNLI